MCLFFECNGLFHVFWSVVQCRSTVWSYRTSGTITSSYIYLALSASFWQFTCKKTRHEGHLGLNFMFIPWFIPWFIPLHLNKTTLFAIFYGRYDRHWYPFLVFLFSFFSFYRAVIYVPWSMLCRDLCVPWSMPAESTNNVISDWNNLLGKHQWY